MEPVQTPSTSDSHTPRRRWLGLLARVLIIGAIFYFIFVSLWRNWGELREHEFAVRWNFVGLSYAVLCVHMLNRSLIWHYLTRMAGCDIGLSKSLVAWFISLLGKYIPGKVFTLAGRIHFYHQEGRSSLLVGMCFAVETLVALLAAFVVLLLAPLFAPVPLLAEHRTAAAILLLAFLVAIRPRYLEVAANVVLRFTKRQPITLPLRYRDVVVVLLMYTLNWTLLGIAFLLYVKAIHPVPATHLVYLAGSYALANMVGLLALFAPAGIGVREAILALALTVLMPKAIAIVVTLGARLWMTLGELAAIALVAMLLARARPRYPLESDMGLDAADDNSRDVRSLSTRGRGGTAMAERRDMELFDGIAPKYVRLHTTPSSQAALRYMRLRALRPALRGGRRVGVLLDAGCGIAPTIHYLDGLFDRYIGVDHSQALIDAARRASGSRSDVQLLAANIKDVPLPDGVADTVLAVGALHHMTDLPAVVESLKRLAKPGASFVALEPQRGNPVVQALRAVRKRIDATYSSDQVAFSATRLRELLFSAGLQDVRMEYVGFISPAFAQIAPRPQCIFRGLSAAAIAVDKWLDPILMRAGRWLCWYVVVYGTFPVRTRGPRDGCPQP